MDCGVLFYPDPDGTKADPGSGSVSERTGSTVKKRHEANKFGFNFFYRKEGKNESLSNQQTYSQIFDIHTVCFRATPEKGSKR